MSKECVRWCEEEYVEEEEETKHTQKKTINQQDAKNAVEWTFKRVKSQL